MSKTLVIVESPAKAKTISRFLGKGYEVRASFGHVRDLPEKATDVPANVKGKKWAKLGVNIEGDFEPVYVVTSDKKRYVSDLKDSAKGIDRLLLATDEDREGESISWHILELIKPNKDVKVERIVFHEITPEAINAALLSPRQVDEDLVKAQETRRILDRLYGYTLSPLLWKKVGPKLSAGRVQSVAVRLVVMRERDRRDFVIATYSSLEAELATGSEKFKATLRSIKGVNVATGNSFNDRGELTSPNITWLKAKESESLAEVLAGEKPWRVATLEKKEGYENPPAPFMTSTLQQEANRKFGFGTRRTMQIAQQLYEGIDTGSGSTGLITYMRTDSLTLADRALQEARSVIADKYGKEYVPASPRMFKSKAKNAQEAHEAIRPTELARTPESIRRYLSDEQFKLYDLIWKRTLACQMERARVERTKAEIEVKHEGDAFVFGASGKTILFPGFLRVYVEGADDPEAELGDKETLLPELKQGMELDANKVWAEEHSTRPPARFTEASLVQKLEAEGVGRPSTYASIISTIQDRGYVYKIGNQLVPTFTAFAVTELLENHFAQLVDLQFTAEMENQLDEIAEGRVDPVQHLKHFYYGEGEELGIAAKVEKRGPDIPFPALPLGEDIVVRIGRNGPFIQRGEGGPGNTASVPEEIAPADLTLEKAKELLEERAKGPESVGTDPVSGRQVYAKSGRFGAYLEVSADEGETPKRVTLPPGVQISALSEDIVVRLLEFPKVIGAHPETGDDIVLAVGRYGAYLTAGEKRANAGDWEAALALDVDSAVKLIAEGGRGRKAAGPSVLAELGEAEGVAGPVRVLDGRYGPYVSDGEVNATIPKGTDPKTIDLAAAVELIKARAALGPVKKTRRKASTKKTASKSTPKKATAKKTTAKKAPAKKAPAKKTPKKGS